ncbi:DUF6234 family protein [Kitasatospora sp. NPDC049285]|uniref:DUF6234 family protein n=1 Tax=Kitasatospora sp. NPDC049285 TaxID=3157096 RepID=UPI0034253ECD
MTRRAPIAVDLLTLLGLLCLEAAAGAALLLRAAFADGSLDGSAAQPYDLVPVLLGCAVVPVVAAVLTWRGGLRVTAVAQALLLAAVLALAAAGSAYDHRHEEPRPLPSGYQPCYSGSDCSATGG